MLVGQVWPGAGTLKFGNWQRSHLKHNVSALIRMKGRCKPSQKNMLVKPDSNPRITAKLAWTGSDHKNYAINTQFFDGLILKIKKKRSWFTIHIMP